MACCSPGPRQTRTCPVVSRWWRSVGSTVGCPSAGPSAVAELENQVAPRAPTFSKRTATHPLAAPGRLRFLCVRERLPAVGERGAGDVEVTRLAGGGAGAARIGLGGADRCRDASLDRRPVGCDVVSRHDANPSRVPSDERIAYVCAEMNRCIPIAPMSVKPKLITVTGFGARPPVRGVRDRDVRPAKKARAVAVASSPSAATRRPCRK